MQGCAGMWRRRDAGPETPPASQQQPSAPPGGSGRRAATPWDSAPPSRWAPSSPGTGRPATAAGPSLSGDPAAAGPLASAAASTGVDLTAQAALASATRGRSPPPPALRERARARARRPLAVGSARHSPHPLGRAGLGTLSGLPASMRSTAAVAGVETFLGQTPLLRVFCLRRAAGGLTNPRWGEGTELAKEAGQDQDWAAATGAERRSVGLVGWTGSWAGRSQTREWGLR